MKLSLAMSLPDQGIAYAMEIEIIIVHF